MCIASHFAPRLPTTAHGERLLARNVRLGHVAKAAQRAAQTGFQARQGEWPVTRPNQRLHVQLRAMYTFAMKIYTVLLAGSAARGNAPAIAIGLALVSTAERTKCEQSPSGQEGVPKGDCYAG
jgi:hypothetical protein